MVAGAAEPLDALLVGSANGTTDEEDGEGGRRPELLPARRPCSCARGATTGTCGSAALGPRGGDMEGAVAVAVAAVVALLMMFVLFGAGEERTGRPARRPAATTGVAAQESKTESVLRAAAAVAEAEEAVESARRPAVLGGKLELILCLSSNRQAGNECIKEKLRYNIFVHSIMIQF